MPFFLQDHAAQDNGTSSPSHDQPRRHSHNDWKAIGGGDGMQPRVDRTIPNHLHDDPERAISRSGKPIRPKGAKAIRWNWDTPFIISPHSAKRLYLAGSVLYRSDDRGDTWTAISPDLTRQLDRTKVPVMGKLWGPDAVTRNLFTTELSVASALAESPVQEGLLFVGTDEGLVQISEDGGKVWRKSEKFPGVPDQTYVSDLCASQHDSSTIYAAFNNWQRGDFKPYLLKSTDRGKTWNSIAGNLPGAQCLVRRRGSWQQKFIFAGTEFGLFFTVDGGKQWVQLKGGVPTIAFRDLEIQRAKMIVGATFGRGFCARRYAVAATHVRNARRGGTMFMPQTYRFEPGDADVAGSFTTPNPQFGARHVLFA